MLFQKKKLLRFSLYSPKKKPQRPSPNYCGPTSPPDITILTSINLFHLRTLPHRYRFFSYWFLRKDYQIFVLYTCIFICKILNFKFEPQPLLWAKPGPSIMIWTYVNLSYLSMFQQSYRFFVNWFWERSSSKIFRYIFLYKKKLTSHGGFTLLPKGS